MEWFVPNDLAAAGEIRREVRAYLERHATPSSDIDGAVLAFSELLTNAVVHGGADAWVVLDWGGINPVVTIHDLGEGFEITDAVTDPMAISGRGLMIASKLSLGLRTAAKTAGGNRTTAVLPVERIPSADIDPQGPLRSGRLPRAEEARPDGYFGRESFLRALVVEIADGLEREHGPDAAEHAVAQVGASVGGQMETAYRAVRELVDALDREQIAELYVGLKASIGGGFYVVSVDDDKIVLGNRTCPFGEAVTHAPSLCRMTSSVFGGIAARNTGRDVAVHLEERIAVGDPECRVVVWFEPPPLETEVFVHRYRPGRAD